MKIHKDSRGIVHPLVLVLAVVVIAAIGITAWKVVANSKPIKTISTAAANPISSKAAETACKTAVNDNNLCNFASHYNASASYKATDTSTTSDGTSTLTISSDGKGNSEIATTGGSNAGDVISLNGATYIKDASSGNWIKYAASSSTPSTNPANDLKLSANDITDNGNITYTNLGKAACGKLTCFKYQVADKTQAGTTQYVWFDDKDYQLQELYVQDGSGTNDMKFSYESVSIKTPSPVQDYSAPTGGGAYSVPGSSPSE